jgi:uncharacterized membrane protein
MYHLVHSGYKQEAKVEYETTVEIDAPAARAWKALTDIEQWPAWTRSMRHVRWMGNGAMSLGSSARIKQPGTIPLVWEVCEIDPGTYFSWKTTSLGIEAIATHLLRPIDADRVELTLGIRQSGALAPIVDLLTGRRTKRFVQMEAQGLKRCSESPAELQ